MAPSVRLPVLDGDDIAYEPTERSEFSFGQWTLPVKKGATRRMPPAPHAPPSGELIPRSRIPTAPRRTLPTPMFAPPPSASGAIGLGVAIGASLGVALLGVVWHFIG